MKSLRPPLAALTALALLPLAAGSQPPEPPEVAGRQPDITVIVDKSMRPRLRLAMPEMGGLRRLESTAARAAQELDETLREDLLASGVFDLQGPAELAVLAITGDRARDFEQYRSLGNELLLEAEITREGERLVLEGRIFELASGRSLLGKRYRGTFDVTRRIAHTFADEIVLFFTGRQGLALTQIAFQSDRGDRQNREIYIMDYDGWNQRPVTAHKTISMSPEWSPDGNSVAYVSYLTRAPGIRLVDLRSGKKRALVTDGTLNISPAFSPDGRRIAFARTVGDGNTEVFIAAADGSGVRRLTHSSGIDTNPAWSPTGRQIAFTSNRGGSPQIYLMGTEGTDLRRITFEGDYNDGAAWSPDGSRIAHATRRGSGFDIAVTDLVTLESKVLVSGPGSHESPSFSPDGRKIAFAWTRPGAGTQIYVASVEGGEVRQLTREGSNLAPAWSGYLK